MNGSTQQENVPISDGVYTIRIWIRSSIVFIVLTVIIVLFRNYWKSNLETPQVKKVESVADSIGQIAREQLGMRFTVRAVHTKEIGDSVY